MKKIIFLSMLISTMIYAEAVNVKKYIVNYLNIQFIFK